MITGVYAAQVWVTCAAALKFVDETRSALGVCRSRENRGRSFCRTQVSKQFFLRKTATVCRAFSGADQSRARLVRVHRRPLTGSTAGKRRL